MIDNSVAPHSKDLLKTIYICTEFNLIITSMYINSIHRNTRQYLNFTITTIIGTIATLLYWTIQITKQNTEECIRYFILNGIWLNVTNNKVTYQHQSPPSRDGLLTL